MTRYSLSFIKTGGFIATYQRIDVDSTTRTMLFREKQDTTPRAAILTEQEIDAITSALDVANVPGTRRRYRCRGCADMFSYDLTIHVAAAVYEVHWEDASQAPEALFKLGSLLMDIASRHFPGRTRGAPIE